MNRGKLGEDLAASFLEARGYAVLARNFRTRYGEIDIIAEKDGFVAFVEVKLRKSARYGVPCEAVTAWKQKKIICAAEEWLALHPDGGQPRFDVIEIIVPSGAALPANIRHLENAFDA